MGNLLDFDTGFDNTDAGLDTAADAGSGGAPSTEEAADAVDGSGATSAAEGIEQPSLL